MKFINVGTTFGIQFLSYNWIANMKKWMDYEKDCT